MGSTCWPCNSWCVFSVPQKNCAESCSFKYKPYYGRRSVDDIFVLFNSSEHLKSQLNSGHANISFTIENEKESRRSFLDVNITCEQDKFTTSFSCKPTFSGTINQPLSSAYKIELIHTLLCRCFRMCSDFAESDSELG